LSIYLLWTGVNAFGRLIVLLPAFQGIRGAGYNRSSARQLHCFLRIYHHFVSQPLSQSFHLRLAVQSPASCVDTTHWVSTRSCRRKTGNKTSYFGFIGLSSRRP